VSTTKGKRAFAPSQPQAKALDFSAAAEAFTQAHAAVDSARGNERATERAADKEAEVIDHLLGLPAPDLASVATKLDAYEALFGSGGLLSDPAYQRRLATGADEAAKARLALWLDVTALNRSDLRRTWEAALADFLRIKADYDAVRAWYDGTSGENEDEDEPVYTAASERLTQAMEALLNTRAPDAAAMAFKARLVFERAHVFYVDDGLDSPSTISHLLAGTWDETLVAALHQDGLALEGHAGPLVEVRADPFKAEAWIAEAEKGGRLAPDPDMTKPGWQVLAPTNPAALDAFNALPLGKRWEVYDALAKRDEQATRFRARVPSRWDEALAEVKAIKALEQRVKAGADDDVVAEWERREAAFHEMVAALPMTPENVAYRALSIWLIEAPEAGAAPGGAGFDVTLSRQIAATLEALS